MAITTLTVGTNVKELQLNTPLALPEMAALDASEGAKIKLKDYRDDKFLLLIQNSATSAQDVTIKAGNGLQGVCDLVYNIAGSTTAAVVLESMKYQNVTGENAGYVIVTGAATVKIGAVVLP